MIEISLEEVVPRDCPIKKDDCLLCDYYSNLSAYADCVHCLYDEREEEEK